VGEWLGSCTRGQTLQLGLVIARVLTTLLVQNMDKITLGIAQSPQGDALCVEGKVIGGETISIWGKGVNTVAKGGIIKRSASIGTLDGYRAIGSRVQAIRSQSL
jgi:hypothetical protein